MKSRFLAAILALCLTLTLLPSRALATESDSTEYWINMSAEEARTMLRAVADKTESRYIVFVYYNAPTAANIIEKQFRKYANDKGYYIYGYYTGNGGSLADELAPLFAGSTNLALPVAVTWNPSTQTCMAEDNVIRLEGPATPEFNYLITLMAANGLGHGSSAPDSTGTTPSDPDNTNPPPSAGDPDSASSIPGVSEQAWEVLRLLNIYRMERGLQPLSTFAEVQEAANIRAKELFLYCSHNRPDGGDYSTVFPEVGLRLGDVITSWAENIASGQKDAAGVMTSWMLSPGHNANMIKPSGRVHIGVGYDYQTNGIPSLYSSNWVQNFVAAYDCSFTNLQLSRDFIEGKPGTDLEVLLKDAGIEVTANCYRHGKSSLPLIAAMCSGYDAGCTDAQVLTVTYGGQTAKLTVGDHSHEWNDGSETMPSTCTDPGRKTCTCSLCGADKVEDIPPAGHVFIEGIQGMYTCEKCDAVIPAGWKPVYEELTEDTGGNKLRYPHDVAGIDMSADEATIMNYLTECVEGVFGNTDTTNYSCDILDGRFIENQPKFEYRIGIRALESPEPQTFSMLRSYFREDYILISEPMILFLNYISGDDPASEEVTGVATPNETAPEEKPPEPLEPPEPFEPQPPSDPFEPPVPSIPFYPQVPNTSFYPQTSSGLSGDWGSSSAAPDYHISAPQTAGGQVTVSSSSALCGQRVTVTALPDSGYALDTLMAADAYGNEVVLRNLGDGIYEFTMPASKVVFTVSFEKVRTESVLNPIPMFFMDVPDGSWFYSGVDYVWKHYLMNGVSNTRFNPDGAASRAMVWTILYRMHDMPAGANPDAVWYRQGQTWAIQQGVSDGTNPTGGVTREQAAVMLWRDAGSPGAAAVLRDFGDSGSVSDYARAAICWAVENGIMQGSAGMLHPQNTVSRAEMAMMIARYAEQTG